MEAMHTSDLIFFRRSTPSPIPRFYATSDKDDATNVSSDMIEHDVFVEEVKEVTEERNTNTLTVTAHDERRLQIQSVRLSICKTMNISCQTFPFVL